MLLYLCQDGEGPSGVAAYGYSVLRHVRDARMLLLNADRPPRTAPVDLHDRIATIPRMRSHDVDHVARAIASVVSAMEGPVTVLPNSGDTPWAATAAWLRGLPASAREQCRVLGIVHSDMDTQYALAKRYRGIAPVWIGVSRRCAAELRAHVEASGVEVHELPYPIEPAPAVDRHVDGPLRLAYVGRLEEPQKRVSRLVPLVEETVRLGVDAQLTVAGAGPAAEDFMRAVRNASDDARSRIRCAGTLGPDDVRETWQAHDVCILVSAFEGLPLSLLEAMAAGVCPVVMHVDSGITDVLEHGRNAVIVEQGDVRGMAREIARLHVDRRRLAELQHAARETTTGFGPARHFASLEHIVNACWRRPEPDAANVTADETSAAVERIAAEAGSTGRPVIVYGAGMFGRKVVDRCLAEGVLVVGLVDGDAAQAGLSYRGRECRRPETLADARGVTVAIGSLHYADEIAERVSALCAGGNVIVVRAQPSR